MLYPITRSLSSIQVDSSNLDDIDFKANSQIYVNGPLIHVLLKMNKREDKEKETICCLILNTIHWLVDDLTGISMCIIYLLPNELVFQDVRP